MADSKTFVSKSYKTSRYRIRDRSGFISRVYRHLLGAVLIVIFLEVILFQAGIAQPLSQKMLKAPWLLILAALHLVGWLARRMTYRAQSLVAQYGGLAIYIVAKTAIIMPLLYLADTKVSGVIQNAAQFTIIGFLGLTWVAFSTRKDFNFLRAFLRWGGFIAIGLIVVAVVYRFHLGIWFNIGVIALAGTAILYDTSSIIRRYREDRYVAAATALFASVALMFWHALRMFQRLAKQG